MWFFPKSLLHPIFTIWFNFITLGWFCSIQLILPVFLYFKMCGNIANYQFNNSIDFLLRFWCLRILIFFCDSGASYSDVPSYSASLHILHFIVIHFLRFRFSASLQDFCFSSRSSGIFIFCLIVIYLKKIFFFFYLFEIEWLIDLEDVELVCVGILNCLQ